MQDGHVLCLARAVYGYYVCAFVALYYWTFSQVKEEDGLGAKSKLHVTTHYGNGFNSDRLSAYPQVKEEDELGAKPKRRGKVMSDYEKWEISQLIKSGGFLWAVPIDSMLEVTCLHGRDCAAHQVGWATHAGHCKCSWMCASGCKWEIAQLVEWVGVAAKP